MTDLFDTSHTIAAPLFDAGRDPREIPDLIGGFILEHGPDLPDWYEEILENVWVGKGAVIAASVTITGPVIIGRDVKIRPGVTLRKNVIVGDGVLIGGSVEIANSILFDGVQVQGRNRIEDSIAGRNVVIGEGAVIVSPGGLVGDGAIIGNGAAVNPGAVVGRNARVCPGVSVDVPESGVLKEQRRRENRNRE